MNSIAAGAFSSVTALGEGLVGNPSTAELHAPAMHAGPAGQKLPNARQCWPGPTGAYRTVRDRRHPEDPGFCPSTRRSTNRPRWSRQSRRPSTPRHNPVGLSNTSTESASRMTVNAVYPVGDRMRHTGSRRSWTPFATPQGTTTVSISTTHAGLSPPSRSIVTRVATW